MEIINTSLLIFVDTNKIAFTKCNAQKLKLTNCISFCKTRNMDSVIFHHHQSIGAAEIVSFY